jgi:ribosomal protein S18 acetylase RimI-like enzyme
MVLGYRLPVPEHAATMRRRCDSLHPVSWLERRPPASYYLNTLAIYPEYQKLGFGGLLLSTAEAEARRSGSSCMILETARDNHSAMRFYGRNGFVAWAPDGGGMPGAALDTGEYVVLGKWLAAR